MMNEKLVLKTAKSLNKEKFILEKLNKQIDNLREKEEYLKKELAMSAETLEKSKQKEQEIKEANMKVKIMAEEEIMKNKKDHNELLALRDMKKNLQKELNRAVQDNLNAKYNLQSQREQKEILENNLRGLQDSYNQVTYEKDSLNQELLRYKQEYDELMQLYELKRNEDLQLKTLYKFHFK
jgi:chromosome segregation ATPase